MKQTTCDERGNALSRLQMLLRALAGSQRLEILLELANEPKDVSAVALALELDLSPVSQGLRSLRECGLVEMHREGLRHIHRLSPFVRVVMIGYPCLEVRCGLGRLAISLEQIEADRVRSAQMRSTRPPPPATSGSNGSSTPKRTW